MYNRNAVLAYKKRKLERKIADKEAEKDQLRRKVTRKQKKFDFGPFKPKYLKVETGPVKYQMKTIVMVEGIPKGVTLKTRAPHLTLPTINGS